MLKSDGCVVIVSGVGVGGMAVEVMVGGMAVRVGVEDRGVMVDEGEGEAGFVVGLEVGLAHPVKSNTASNNVRTDFVHVNIDFPFPWKSSEESITTLNE